MTILGLTVLCETKHFFVCKMSNGHFLNHQNIFNWRMERNPNENKQNLLLNRQKVDLPFESVLVLN